ncbi:MAG: VanW family protein [Patescibacteria group bacterium]
MNKSQRQILIVGLISAAALSLVAGGYSIVKQPESVFVQRMSLPQMEFTQSTFAEAALALQVQEDAFLLKEVELTSERGNVTTTLQNLGVDAQTNEAVDYLLNFNENAGALEKLTVYIFGNSLKTEVTVDSEKLKLAFAESRIEQGMKEPEYGFENGQVVIVPEQIGYGIDLEALTEQIQNYWEDDFTVPGSDELPLRVKEPEIRDTDLETLIPTVETLASRALTLQDEFGNTWGLTMAEHLDWIRPVGDAWQIDETKFITYVETDLVPEVEAEPSPAIITENEDGTISFEGSARFGVTINKTDLMASITGMLMAEPSEAVLEIPVAKTEPQVTVSDSLRERGITELVGVGYSTYNTSPANRIANVNRGFEQFNGVIIEQGTEFSFTDLMGPIDAANGWLPELVIKGDETIPEYGGGLCQVSSTMFRAALYSGLPITQRKNHSYAVSYYAAPYGYGLDATVYDPNPNLKFMNDTPGDLLIQGYTDGFDAYFVLYGTYDGRTVKMEGPYTYGYTNPPAAVTSYTDELAAGVRVLEAYGHTGFKVDWYRTVTYLIPTEEELAEGAYVSSYAAAANGVRENIHSDYEARPAKYTEGAGEEAEEIGETN